VLSRTGRTSSASLRPRTREVGTREPRKRWSFAIFSLLRRRFSSGEQGYRVNSWEFDWREHGRDEKEYEERMCMERSSSSDKSINEAESTASLAPAILSLAFPLPILVPPSLVNDGSDMESASVGLDNIKWLWIASMESEDRAFCRNAQFRRGQRRSIRVGGSLLETRPGRPGGVTASGEGVSPNSCVNFRDFLTSSARSCGCRWFVVGGRSSNRSETPNLSRGLVSTAVTGAEMEV
jgi:hypothetical protein